MSRNCKNSPDRFCYVCGQVTFTDQQCTITPLIKSLYHAYFGIRLGNFETSERNYLFFQKIAYMYK